MKPFPVPVVGAGSQPDEEPLQYLASPGVMETFRPPVERVPASAQAREGARRLLSRLLSRMEETPFSAAELPAIDLTHEPADAVAEFNELLGQGEVSCRVSGPRDLRIQESAFAAVWRVREYRQDGALLSDRVETGAIPGVVHEVLRAWQGGVTAPAAEDPGVMNAPALLHEILDASAALAAAPATPVRVINLTLLPVTASDISYLSRSLGSGPIAILSRGYGNCRITATAVPHVWWVQYYNSMDQIILDTIEVVAVPEVALAAREDYEDSAERLAEWITTLEP